MGYLISTTFSKSEMGHSIFITLRREVGCSWVNTPPPPPPIYLLNRVLHFQNLFVK